MKKSNLLFWVFNNLYSCSSIWLVASCLHCSYYNVSVVIIACLLRIHPQPSNKNIKGKQLPPPHSSLDCGAAAERQQGVLPCLSHKRCAFCGITGCVPYATCYCPWLFCNYQSALLNPITIFTQDSENTRECFVLFFLKKVFRWFL